MHLFRTLLATSALPLGVLSKPVGSTNSSDEIKWTPCYGFENITKVECGNLTVPLDYTNETDTRTVTLNLIKNPAQKQPARKGSILLNYGGPGGDGINNFMLYYEKQRKYIGPDHDMISWDPRATRRTLPAVCINETDPNAANLITLGQDWHDSSNASAGTNWAEATVISDLCYGAMQEFGQYVGMASTSRDMMAIVDALGEDGMLRYWGISGGTGLGTTTAAMFPDRMDKVILDGVMNVHQYYNDLAETEWFSNSDDAFNSIMEACVELGPEKCPLARNNCTSKDLIRQFDAVFEDLKRNPIPSTYPDLGLASIIDYYTVMDYVYTRLYAPYKFVYLVGILEALLERNGTKYDEIFALDQAASPRLPYTDPVPGAQFAASAIRCGDRFPRTDDPEDVQKVLDISHEISPKFGYYGANLNAQLCAQWKFKAVERYDGDFNVSTKNPVLFIGNTYDPATPLVSARNMSSTFDGSVVLEQESLGHVTFMTQESNCTRDAILGYLGDGKLPENNTKCKPNLPTTSYVAGEFEGLDHV